MKLLQSLVRSVCAFAFCKAALAQPGSLDLTFNPGSGANATVLCTTIQINGQIVVGGYFTTFNGANRRYIARLNWDGSVDPYFDSGTLLNAEVNSVVIQPDGNILIQGWFTGHFARLRADGSRDTSFTSLFGDVRGIALQKDDNILVVGLFPGLPSGTNYVQRISTNGLLDGTFKSAALTGGDGSSYVLGLQSDDRILVGGPFTKINGLSRNYLARLLPDGNIDTNFNAAISGSGKVSCLAITSQDKIVIGGNFSTINGYSRNGIARLNADGSVDTSFNPGLGTDEYVTSVAIQTNGQVLIGGAFHYIDGTNRTFVARLNTNGTLDLSFNAGTVLGQSVACVANQWDGRVLVGGAIGTFNGIEVNGIARLNGDSSPPTDLQFLTPNHYFGTYLQGAVSNIYRIESTTNLNTPSLWTPLFNVTLQTNPQFILDPVPTSEKRFYRAVGLPAN